MLTYRHKEEKGGDHMPVKVEANVDDIPEIHQEKDEQ